VTLRLSGAEGSRGGYLEATGNGKMQRIELRPYPIEGMGSVLEGTTTSLAAGDWTLEAFVDAGNGIVSAGMRAPLTVG